MKSILQDCTIYAYKSWQTNWTSVSTLEWVNNEIAYPQNRRPMIRTDIELRS